MNRPDLYVVARFLEALWLRGGEVRRTDLQMATNVNYNVFLNYLGLLIEKGLVSEREVDGEMAVQITSKGVDAYNALVKLVKDVFEAPRK